ncbi:primosomal replication protein N [Oxalobacteraceae bacterium GrIS 2.11]
MNQFQLVAQVVEREMLRYSPGGVPIVSAKLAHSSQQLEARVSRLVEFEVSALAIGEISGRFDKLDLGKNYQFTGFLARKNRNSKSLIFHIIDFSEIEAIN